MYDLSLYSARPLGLFIARMHEEILYDNDTMIHYHYH